MKKTFRGFLAAATVVTSLGAGAINTDAQAGFAFQVYVRIANLMPKCRDNPDYPVIGRVAGFVNDGRPRRVAWVGCFPSFRQCEAWRRQARGAVNPPIQFNTCEERF